MKNVLINHKENLIKQLEILIDGLKTLIIRVNRKIKRKSFCFFDWKWKNLFKCTILFKNKYLILL